MTISEACDILLGTFTMRPYVFAFFGAFLLASVPHVGWRRSAIFAVTGYLIAFASEWLSINTGFPYGWYYYINTTSHKELWIAGVPFFDSLSYVFLTYCSYGTALFILSPIKAWRWDMLTLESCSIRRSWAALLLGAFLQTFLDIVIDPVALQGKRWFLGQIYGYRELGVHFGVPLSNYAGWLLTSFFLVGAFQLIDMKPLASPPKGVCNIPFRSLMAPMIYLSVIIFNIAITFRIGETLMGLSSILIYILPLVIVITLAFRRVNRYSAEELAEHLRDYPWSAAGRGK
jgi:uncharacterized membrane protein